MMQLAYDPLALFVASIVLAAVFARGAWHKLSELDMFRATFEAYEIVPARMAHALAPVLGVLEALVAIGLLVPPLRWLVAPIAILLLASYAAGIAINIMRGRHDIDCGCGGTGEGLSWLLVGRNLALVAAGFLVMLPVSAREFGLRDWLALPLLIACLWLLLLALEQTGANNAARRRLLNVFERGA